MRTDTATRIAERTRIADLQMRGQNWFGRAANRTGLFIANTVDRLTGWADNNRVVFLGATTAGLMRGAAYGLITAVLITGVFGIAMGAGALLGLMAAGAVGYGIHDGQKTLERHLVKDEPRGPDAIAETFGAIPAKLSPAQQLQEARDNDKANAAAFAKREEIRRSEAQALER